LNSASGFRCKCSKLRTNCCAGGNTDGGPLSSDSFRLAKAEIKEIGTYTYKFTPAERGGTHLNLNGSEIFLANQLSSASAGELGFEFELRGAAIELRETQQIPTKYVMQLLVV
jgi:hypothetical protein